MRHANTRRGQNEGSIYKRTDGRWEAKINLGYVNGVRMRKSFYGETRREVKDQMTAALHLQQQGLPVAHERQTVAQFLNGGLKRRCALPCGHARPRATGRSSHFT